MICMGSDNLRSIILNLVLVLFNNSTKINGQIQDGKYINNTVCSAAFFSTLTNKMETNVVQVFTHFRV